MLVADSLIANLLKREISSVLIRRTVKFITPVKNCNLNWKRKMKARVCSVTSIWLGRCLRLRTIWGYWIVAVRQPEWHTRPDEYIKFRFLTSHFIWRWLKIHRPSAESFWRAFRPGSSTRLDEKPVVKKYVWVFCAHSGVGRALCALLPSLQGWFSPRAVARCA